MRTRAAVWILCVGSVLGAGGGVGAHLALPASPVVEGIYIGERRLPDDETAASWLARRDAELGKRLVHLQSGDVTLRTTLDEVGFRIDIPATVAVASEVGHRGPPWQRVREAREAARGEIDVPLTWTLNEVRAKKLLEQIAERVYRAPVDARLDLHNYRKIPDEPGIALDVEESLARLRAFDPSTEELFVVSTRVVEAETTMEDLVDVDVTKVLADFETTYHTWGSGHGRSINIAEAARRLDGALLKPGDVLSFNQRVGARSLANGFTYAPEIQGDEMTTGIGGGTCQVSSTLHVAAVYGALEVVERRSHSRPSSYTKLGLDATVSYPDLDLKIQNPLPFPILIRSYVPEPGKIKVELLGGDAPAEVDYRYGIANVRDYLRRITVKPHLPPGKRIRRQKGSRGMDVTSVVTYTFADGQVKEKTYYSGYRPAPEVYWISSDYDESELPPLPKHASGVEGREDDFYPM